MRSKTVKKILKSTPEDLRIFVKLHADLVLRINQILRQKGMTQKNLADQMQKKPSEINKWLKGEHNLTLRSIALLEAELGEKLIEVPVTKPIVDSDSEYLVSTFHIVTKKASLMPHTALWEEITSEGEYSEAG